MSFIDSSTLDDFERMLTEDVLSSIISRAEKYSKNYLYNIDMKTI